VPELQQRFARYNGLCSEIGRIVLNKRIPVGLFSVHTEILQFICCEQTLMRACAMYRCTCSKRSQKRTYFLPLLPIYLFFIFQRFCQINYLNIYWHDPHQMYRIGRTTAADELSKVSFSIQQGTSQWQPIFVGFIGCYPQKWVDVCHSLDGGVYDKKRKCCAECRQTN